MNRFGIAWRLFAIVLCTALLGVESALGTPHTLPYVPAYDWYHGCGPTAAASIIGYYDIHGCGNLFTASGWNNVKLTANVQDQISSPAHNAKYDPKPDDPDLPTPPDTSIADFFHTSEGSHSTGGSSPYDSDDALRGYAQYRGYSSATASWDWYGLSFGWSDLVGQIDAGRPMMFNVDSDGDGDHDHFVPVFGYDDRGADGQYYGFYTTWSESETIRWERFRGTSSSYTWGVFLATYFSIPFTPDQAPVAAADAYGGNEDVPITIAAAGVLTNDTEPEGEPLTAVKVSNPSHGTVTLNSNGSFTYTPTANYFGSDSFTYKASDSYNDSGTVTVTLTVASVNDLPVAVGDAYGGSEDVPVTIAAKGVLTNDTDVESNPLTALKITNPAHGSVALSADGSFTYTPSANYHGADSFTYKANDGYGDSTAAATVNLTVASVNDVPVAASDSYGATEDAPLTVYSASGVLKNDTDADNTDEDTEHDDTLTAVLVSSTSGGTLTLGATGWLTYTPSANWHGADSFTYKVNDGAANSNVATVNVDVVSVNDAPIAVDDSYLCVADATNTIYSSLGVLKNDTDPDNIDNDTTHQDALTATLGTSTTHGSLTLGAAGWFTYTPTTGYRGADSFTYKVFDGTVYSGLATVLLDVFGPAVILPGDATGDGHVNQADAAIVAQYWGQSVSSASHGDFNGDGVVNAADASILAANWGYSAAEAGQVAVPEPSALALLVIGTVGLVTCRWRRER